MIRSIQAAARRRAEWKQLAVPARCPPGKRRQREQDRRAKSEGIEAANTAELAGKVPGAKNRQWNPDAHPRTNLQKGASQNHADNVRAVRAQGHSDSNF